MIKLEVANTSAVSEPRTTVTATTYFPRFPGGATFGAYGTDDLRRGCRCVYVRIGQKKQPLLDYLVSANIYRHGVSLRLTFACLHALGPHVIGVGVSVAGTAAAVFIPSTARSATTDSA